MVMMEFSSYDIQGTNRTMKKMLVFTVMMVVVPIVSYFFSKSFIFEGLLGMKGSNSSLFPAIVSIVVVHVILGCFIYVAFTEDGTSRRTPEKED